MRILFPIMIIVFLLAGCNDSGSETTSSTSPQKGKSGSATQELTTEAFLEELRVNATNQHRTTYIGPSNPKILWETDFSKKLKEKSEETGMAQPWEMLAMNVMADGSVALSIDATISTDKKVFLLSEKGKLVKRFDYNARNIGTPVFVNGETPSILLASGRLASSSNNSIKLFSLDKEKLWETNDSVAGSCHASIARDGVVFLTHLGVERTGWAISAVDIKNQKYNKKRLPKAPSYFSEYPASYYFADCIADDDSVIVSTDKAVAKIGLDGEADWMIAPGVIIDHTGLLYKPISQAPSGDFIVCGYDVSGVDDGDDDGLRNILNYEPTAKLVRITADGKKTVDITSGEYYGWVHNVAIDSDNTIYMYLTSDVPTGDESGSCVSKLIAQTIEGEKLWQTDLTDTWALASSIWVDEEKNIYIPCDENIRSFDSTGKLRWQVDFKDTVTGIAFNPHGIIYAYTMDDKLYAVGD